MKKLFVGNLPHSTTEAELRTLFEPHGKVDQVSLVTDRDTGRSRGFAFVEMADAAEAEKAIAALNGKELGGRALNINEARPRPIAAPADPAVVDVPVAADVRAVAAVDATTIRATPASLANLAGNGILSFLTTAIVERVDASSSFGGIVGLAVFTNPYQLRFVSTLLS